MKISRIPYTGERRRKDEEHRKDVKFLETNYDDLMLQFPEKWIAIKSQRVVAVADDHLDLAHILRSSGLGRHVSLMEHMTGEDVIWVLAKL